MDSIVSGLNDAQRIAVTSPASTLQCLAPPGSGKTKTLTSRVAYLIRNHGLNPSNIIVCTFTVKAAKEMARRIEGFLGKEYSTKLMLGTFHSIARRFLAVHGAKINLEQKFGIADTTDSKAIVTRIIEKLKLTISPGIARSRISKLKADGITADKHVADIQAKSKPGVDLQEMSQVYVEYEDHLKISNLLDYDDLLLRCMELLRRCPECVSRIEAVLVDEFQDTNQIQYDLMNLFAQQQQAITVVCDPDQSIYGWRSAKIENIKKMQMLYPDTHVVNLEENYRSSSCILFAAQELIEQDQSRHQKCLAPTHSAGEPPTLRRLGSAGEEAVWTACELRRIHALTGGLLRWDDFAVLLRSAVLSRLIEKELGNAGIPYRMVGGQRFYDRVEIKLVLDYLRVLDNPNHSEAIARVINVPARKIGEKTIEKLLQEADSRKQSLWMMVLRVARGELTIPSQVSSQAQKGLESFVNLMLRAKAKLLDDSERSLADLIRWLVGKLELRTYLKGKYPLEDDYSTRWGNIQELITQAEEGFATELTDEDTNQDHNSKQRPEEGRNPSRVEELELFLANISLSADVRQNEKNDEANAQGCVTLSTMHAAKGLEWPIVFIPAAYNGSIPHSRAEDTDEERRLLYVAMTRAQCLLYISCPKRDSRNSDVELSPFLQPKAVQQRHAKRGPSLTYDLIREMAKIMGRGSQGLDIEKGRASAPSQEDDLFYQAADRSGQDQYGSDEGDLEITDAPANANPQRKRGAQEATWHRNNKRQNRCSTTWGAPTTMQSTASYSISKMTYTSSFVSAKALPQAEKENQKPAPNERLQHSRPKGSVKPAVAQGQQSISTFFGKPPVPAGRVEISTAHASTVRLGSSKAYSPAASSSSRSSATFTVQGTAGDGKGPTPVCSAYKPPTINNGPGATKTLGVRRSNNSGWSDRMSRELTR